MISLRIYRIIIFEASSSFYFRTLIKASVGIKPQKLTRPIPRLTLANLTSNLKKNLCILKLPLFGLHCFFALHCAIACYNCCFLHPIQGYQSFLFWWAEEKLTFYVWQGIKFTWLKKDYGFEPWGFKVFWVGEGEGSHPWTSLPTSPIL